jgi:carbonic anhydrase
VSETDRLVKQAQEYPARYGDTHIGLSARPERRVAVVACMDARMDMFALFGLGVGDAHIIRNAGGLVSDDAVRSLAISHRFLGTREIVLVHHTGCGLYRFDDEKFAAELEAETGHRPTWRAGGFADPFEDVRRSIELIRSDPFILHKDEVRGFVFDVDTGALTEA